MEKLRLQCTVMAMAIATTMMAQIDLPTKYGNLTLTPIADNAVRVNVKPQGYKKSWEDIGELIYVETAKPEYNIEKSDSIITVTLKGMVVVYDIYADKLTYKDTQGNVVLSEIAGGRKLVPSEVQGEPTYIAAQRFATAEDEYIAGTGQFQDGILNVRGLTRRLTQVNTQISIPMITSNKGYSLLWNNYGMTEYNPSSEVIPLDKVEDNGDKAECLVNVTSTHGNIQEKRKSNDYATTIRITDEGDYSIIMDCGQRMARKHKLWVDGEMVIDHDNLWLPPTSSCILHLDAGDHTFTVEGDNNDMPTIGIRKVERETEFSSPVADGIDYTVFVGTPDEAIAAYRSVTGGAPLMPKWALGYIHCRERYTSQDDILQNANTFIDRKIPMDVIVQDWQWWGKHGWNAMQFDEDYYPDPQELTDSLHKLDKRLMLSVWSKIDKNSRLGKEVDSLGYYIPQTDWIDFFDSNAADYYWKNFSGRLLQPYHIDAWWQDATEPENDDLVGRRICNGKIAGERLRNVYPLMVNHAVYGGLRADDPERRPMILTRCGTPGIQRYGAATWSGDVGHDFNTLRQQIVAGLGYMASGLPWWTYDAGGFFRPADQYTSEEYHETFVRWLQASTFLPLMRVHGYMSQTEPWRYGDEVERITRKYIELRYRLLPYIYSTAERVTSEGYTLTRPMVMDYYDDPEALKQDCQYMFGPSILVAPVLKSSVDTWRVYLPKGNDWYDYWTDQKYEGGQYVDVDVTLDKIPLYVKAGSIIPMTDVALSTTAQNDLPIYAHVYPGRDCSFTLYDDDGESYAYIDGMYATRVLSWDDTKSKLNIGEAQGKYKSTNPTEIRLVLH